MRRSWRVALAVGVTSLLAVSGLMAASGLQGYGDRIKGLDAAGRRQASKSLTKAERQALHKEFKALSPEGKKAFRQALRTTKMKGRAPNGVGTVQYDTGVPAGVRDNAGNVVGNRFDTGFGNPHSITSVTLQQNGTFATAGGTFIRVYGTPAGTVAPVIGGATYTGAPIGLPFAVNLGAPIAQSGTFLAGLQQSGSFTTINSTFIGVDVDFINGGAGFHGMNINFSGSGFNPAATAAGQPFNTIFRAFGNNLPVELMNFNVQ